MGLDESDMADLQMLWYKHVKDMIAQYGLMNVGVFSTEDDPGPNFTYTIGLHEKYGFELVVFGLPHEIAGYVFNTIAEALAEGKTLKVDELDDRWVNMPVKFMETDESVHGYVVQADQYYQQKVRVLQLVVPDKNGKFFDDLEYDHSYMSPRQILCTRTQLPSRLH